MLWVSEEATHNTFTVRSRTSGELGEVAVEEVLHGIDSAVTTMIDYEAVDDARSRC